MEIENFDKNNNISDNPWFNYEYQTRLTNLYINYLAYLNKQTPISYTDFIKNIMSKETQIFTRENHEYINKGYQFDVSSLYNKEEIMITIKILLIDLFLIHDLIYFSNFTEINKNDINIDDPKITKKFFDCKETQKIKNLKKERNDSIKNGFRPDELKFENYPGEKNEQYLKYINYYDQLNINIKEFDLNDIKEFIPYTEMIDEDIKRHNIESQIIKQIDQNNNQNNSDNLNNQINLDKYENVEFENYLNDNYNNKNITTINTEKNNSDKIDVNQNNIKDNSKIIEINTNEKLNENINKKINEVNDEIKEITNEINMNIEPGNNNTKTDINAYTENNMNTIININQTKNKEIKNDNNNKIINKDIKENKIIKINPIPTNKDTNKNNTNMDINTNIKDNINSKKKIIQNKTNNKNIRENKTINQMINEILSKRNNQNNYNKSNINNNNKKEPIYVMNTKEFLYDTNEYINKCVNRQKDKIIKFSYSSLNFELTKLVMKDNNIKPGNIIFNALCILSGINPIYYMQMRQLVCNCIKENDYFKINYPGDKFEELTKQVTKDGENINIDCLFPFCEQYNINMIYEKDYNVANNNNKETNINKIYFIKDNKYPFIFFLFNKNNKKHCNKKYYNVYIDTNKNYLIQEINKLIYKNQNYEIVDNNKKIIKFDNK